MIRLTEQQQQLPLTLILISQLWTVCCGPFAVEFIIFLFQYRASLLRSQVGRVISRSAQISRTSTANFESFIEQNSFWKRFFFLYFQFKLMIFNRFFFLVFILNGVASTNETSKNYLNSFWKKFSNFFEVKSSNTFEEYRSRQV